MGALIRERLARPALELAPELLGLLLRTADGRGARIVEVEAYGGEEDAASHAWRGRTPRNASMWGPAGRGYVYRSYGIHWCVNVVCSPAGTAGAVLLRAAVPEAGLDLMRVARAGGASGASLGGCSGASSGASSGSSPGASFGSCPGASAGSSPGAPSGSCPGASSGSCPGASSGAAGGGRGVPEPVAVADRSLCRGPGRLCQALGITGSHDGIDLLDPTGPVWLDDDGARPPPAAIARTARIGISRATDLPARFVVSGSPWLSGPARLDGR